MIIMAGSVRTKPHLPKAILEMKFMKRTKDRMEKEKRNTEGHDDLYAASITDGMKQATGNFIIEPSYLVCEDLMEGRLSFKGMNPEIERLMELEKVKTEDMDKDISDEQLSRQFNKFKRSRDISDQANKQSSFSRINTKRIKREPL